MVSPMGNGKEMDMKCRYSHCLHDSKEIPAGEEVKSGKAFYYHKDCYKQKSNIDKVIDIWQKQIDRYVVYAQLRNVINNLVYNRKVDSSFLLYVVERGAKEGYLRYPAGLYYAVNSAERQEEWKMLKAKKALSELQNKPQVKTEQIEQEPVRYTYVPPKEKTLANLFR